MEKDFDAPVFGGISFNQLVDAQNTIKRVVSFIEENRNSPDDEKRELASSAMVITLLDQMILSERINRMVKDEIKERKSVEEKITSVSIPIPTGERS